MKIHERFSYPIECTRCGATAGEQCHTRNGIVDGNTHAARTWAYAALLKQQAQFVDEPLDGLLSSRQGQSPL